MCVSVQFCVVCSCLAGGERREIRVEDELLHVLCVAAAAERRVLEQRVQRVRTHAARVLPPSLRLSLRQVWLRLCWWRWRRLLLVAGVEEQAVALAGQPELKVLLGELDAQKLAEELEPTCTQTTGRAWRTKFTCMYLTRVRTRRMLLHS